MSVNGGAHGPFLAAIAAFLRPNLYLEVGVDGGYSLQMVAPYARHSIGIDRKPWPVIPGVTAMVGEFRDLVPTIQQPIDLAFLDADHSYEATRELFELVWPKMSKTGVVVIHDTDPPDEAHLATDKCGDAWRIRAWLSENDYGGVTLPAQFGLTIVDANTHDWPRFRN